MLINKLCYVWDELYMLFFYKISNLWVSRNFSEIAWRAFKVAKRLVLKKSRFWVSTLNCGGETPNPGVLCVICLWIIWDFLITSWKSRFLMIIESLTLKMYNLSIFIESRGFCHLLHLFVLHFVPNFILRRWIF